MGQPIHRTGHTHGLSWLNTQEVTLLTLRIRTHQPSCQVPQSHTRTHCSRLSRRTLPNRQKPSSQQSPTQQEQWLLSWDLTTNPCTKGLWCWGTPSKGTSSDGEPVNILVIDTEGIGALDEDTTHDTKIFTLAILASSCFIYNSVGSID